VSQSVDCSVLSLSLFSEEAVSSLQGAVPSNLQNPVELEKALFEKSKSAVSVAMILFSTPDEFNFIW
jgi:hypothetical protein